MPAHKHFHYKGQSQTSLILKFGSYFSEKIGDTEKWFLFWGFLFVCLFVLTRKQTNKNNPQLLPFASSLNTNFYLDSTLYCPVSKRKPCKGGCLKISRLSPQWRQLLVASRHLLSCFVIFSKFFFATSELSFYGSALHL